MVNQELVQIDYDKISASTSDKILFLIMEGTLVWIDKKVLFSHDKVNNNFKISIALAARENLI